MRLVTYENKGSGGRIGALTAEGDILDLIEGAGLLALCPAAGRERCFGSMQKLIEAGAEGLDMAAEILRLRPDEAVIGADDAHLLAPLPRPTQIRCFSSFEKHGRQSVAAMMRTMAQQEDDPDAALEALQASGRFDIPDIVYERPFYYKGNRMSVVGTDTNVIWPAYSNLIDYELEIAAVIGKRGVDVTAENARDHFFGYSVCNDLSARDTQALDMRLPLGPAKGKDFDGGIVLGPCIVNREELDDPYSLEMIARVNGEEWGRGRSDDMLFNFEQLLAFVSQSETIYPGEILLSGCVGNRSGMELGRFPVRNDVIELEIENIGKLSNRIV